MSKYKTIIGLELHCELITNSKVFSPSRNSYCEVPNANVNEIDMSFPGIMPYLNKEAVKKALKMSMVLGCTQPDELVFDRKNYYYPDLPKNFQTSQYDLPICLNGYLDIEVGGKTRRIRITRIHMEEDAGKLVHSGSTISTSDSSNVDYNRTGVPLLEIVSEPDMRSGEEARAYVEKLRSILKYLDVSDVRME